MAQTSIAGDAHEYKPVDDLYLNIMGMAARRTRGSLEADPLLCARLRMLTGAVVLLQNPLSIPALAQLIGIREVEVTQDVHALSAVILVGPDTDDTGAHLVRIFHPSFRDFLLERCADSPFSVDATQQHHALSISCLELLNRSLQYDICHIQDPTIPHSQVTSPTLPIRLQKHVSEAVRYACQFWIRHIALSGSPDANLLFALQTFVSLHIFHWIEVLSLTAKLFYAIRYLSDTVAWSKVSH
jgi:hypothetical protein